MIHYSEQVWGSLVQLFFFFYVTLYFLNVNLIYDTIKTHVQTSSVMRPDTTLREYARNIK